jgi:phosphocarrier protein
MKHTVSVEVPNPLGMHARPSAEFVKLAGTFSSSITVTRNDLAVNAKSIMGVLMLAAEQGSVLVITAEGADARRAAEALAALVTGGFDE